MPSPLPEYDDGLVLCSQAITHPLADHPMAITYALDVGTGASVTDGIASANAWKAIFATHWSGTMDSDCVIGALTILVGFGTVLPQKYESSSAGVAGGTAITGPSLNCALLIRKRTGQVGRGNQGRVYLPGQLTEASVDEGGNISPGILTGWQTSANGWLDDLADLTTPMVICNRQMAFNPTPPPAEYVATYHKGFEVTNLTVVNKIGSQRRRIGR